MEAGAGPDWRSPPREQPGNQDCVWEFTLQGLLSAAGAPTDTILLPHRQLPPRTNEPLGASSSQAIETTCREKFDFSSLNVEREAHSSSQHISSDTALPGGAGTAPCHGHCSEMSSRFMKPSPSNLCFKCLLQGHASHGVFQESLVLSLRS